MRYLSVLVPTLLATSAILDPALAARKPSDSVLLSSVKTLTLKKDAKTSHRRVSAIPQLKCTGGNARGLYEVDVMRCKNQGSDYDDENIQWTCTASLPPQFKLGSTDVICEGYSSPTDPYILKGSCGVEYRLALTPEGEAEFGRGGMGDMWEGFKPRGHINWAGLLFWAIFISVIGWMVYSVFFSPYRRLDRGAEGNTQPWGWGGGGGGNDDPPPPYDPHPPRKPQTNTSTRRSTAGTTSGGAAQQGWRPGFWTGILGGTAAGYLAGNRGGRTQEQPRQQRGFWGGGNSPNAGEGPSRWGGGRSGSGFGGGGGYGGTGSSSFASSSRHESTGFGGTSRR